MILISEGKQSMKAKGKQRICHICGARFEYNESDRLRQDGHGWDSVRCPWCKHIIWVKEEEVNYGSRK